VGRMVLAWTQGRYLPAMLLPSMLTSTTQRSDELIVGGAFTPGNFLPSTNVATPIPFPQFISPTPHGLLHLTQPHTFSMLSRGI